jgi:integrase/recombinase XerD
LAPFASGFAAELVARGYQPRPAAEQLLLMGHVSAWLAAHDLGPGDLTEPLADEVMEARRASGRVHLISARALVPLLDYLRMLGVVPVSRPPGAVTAAEVIVERYAWYLRERRSVAPSTVRNTMWASRARSCPGGRRRAEVGLILSAWTRRR